MKIGNSSHNILHIDTITLPSIFSQKNRGKQIIISLTFCTLYPLLIKTWNDSDFIRILTSFPLWLSAFCPFLLPQNSILFSFFFFFLQTLFLYFPSMPSTIQTCSNLPHEEATRTRLLSFLDPKTHLESCLSISPSGQIPLCIDFIT